MDVHTMSPEPTPRLAFMMDVDGMRRVLKNQSERVPKSLAMIADEPGKLEQTRYRSLVSYYRTIAMFSYGLGYDLSEVRDAFSDAAKAWLKVFELRGTEAPFPVYDLTVDPRYPAGHPNSVVSFEKAYPDNAKDYSFTNSKDNFLAVCDALIGGEEAIAAQLAAMAWDPPDARYISPRSETCTPNDQHLAYAVRELFQDNPAGVAAELKKVRTGRKETRVGHQRDLVRALLDQDAEAFADGMEAFLAWYGRRARSSIYKSEFFLCTDGLGLCRLALRRGVCEIEQLPRENVFLPLELIEANRVGDGRN